MFAVGAADGNSLANTPEHPDICSSMSAKYNNTILKILSACKHAVSLYINNYVSLMSHNAVN